jgi:hypothetical protein
MFRAEKCAGTTSPADVSVLRFEVELKKLFSSKDTNAWLSKTQRESSEPDPQRSIKKKQLIWRGRCSGPPLQMQPTVITSSFELSRKKCDPGALKLSNNWIFKRAGLAYARLPDEALYRATLEPHYRPLAVSAGLEIRIKEAKQTIAES